MKTVSIVLPLWNRSELLMHTLESIFRQTDLPPLQVIVVEDRPANPTGASVCRQYPVEYYARHKGVGYNNVGPIYKCGIKKATGDILIMQSADCKYETLTGIRDLVQAIEGDEFSSSVPVVQALNHRGDFDEWYCHPRLGGRPGWTGFFVHAVHRSQIMRIGGYDEIFKGYGYDDDLLLFRMKHNGIVSRFVENVLVSHQYHPRYAGAAAEDAFNRARWQEKQKAVLAGCEPNVANIGKSWGIL